MLDICKMKEPRSLTKHRCSSLAEYQNIPKEAQAELKAQLLMEQGYLCAYCMKTISFQNMKVEHVLSRKEHPELQLDYINMVACCNGNEGKNVDEQHCDTYKKSKSLSKNPASRKDKIQESIKYDHTGGILSKDENFNIEINDTLHLNITLLRNNRKLVYEGVLEQLSKLPKNAGYNKIYKLLKEWQERNKNKKLKQYCGVAIYVLKKRLARCK